MDISDTRKLLDDYVRNGSEPAFRELVTRYTNLVHSTAFRLVNGDSHLAQDISQTVFVDLARTAGTLSRDTTLGGWLHRHTCFVAATTIRRHRRRESREKQAVAMNTPDDHMPANLARLAPVLDEAINELNAEDRAAILLRFFEQLEFRAVGNAIGCNDDAARMRVSRALDKLHALLKNRGVALSATALGTALAAEAVTAAPVGLAATLAGTALAGAAAGGTTALLRFMTLTKLKIGFIGTLAVAALAVPTVVQHQSLAKARAEIQNLHRQADRLTALQAENTRLSNLVATVRDGAGLSDKQVLELVRLRGEVTRLRDTTNQLAAAVSIPMAGVNEPPFFHGGKRILRGKTMAQFGNFLAEVVQAPVADQTGLAGTFDIAMTPPRLFVEKLPEVLANELGLMLVPFDGPFTENEFRFPRPDAAHSDTKGFVLKVAHAGAPGLKPATGDEDPFGLFQADAAMMASNLVANPGSTDPATADHDKCLNNLRQIDAAKQQWALEKIKQPIAVPEWSDLTPYLGRGTNSDRLVCPMGGASYIIGSVGEPPKCSVRGHVLE